MQASRPIFDDPPPPRRPDAVGTVRFRCTTCNKKISLPSASAGKRVLCPGCMAVLLCPQPGAAETLPPTDQEVREAEARKAALNLRPHLPTPVAVPAAALAEEAPLPVPAPIGQSSPLVLRLLRGDEE